MYLYGDFHPNNYNSANYSVCISGVHSFAGAILFSIETQQTIGYGTRVVKETCYLAIVVMMLQSSIGVLLQSFMVGVVFAKISRPKKRTETLIWSREAVICLRDGQMALQCRVGDMRKSHIVEAHIRMYLIKKRVTLEGEILPLHTYDMNVGFDKGIDRLFLIWPLVIEHIIDEQSPLYEVCRADIAQQRFELVVILEGIIESTGMTTQARTSYLPTEILWGCRFERLISFQRDDGLYRIDYSRFNLTYPVDMITCSAKELKELHELEKWHESNQNQNQNHDNNNENDIIFSKSDQSKVPFISHEKKESTL
jgi:potassium inwardly-rectifying channel subfamily J